MKKIIRFFYVIVTLFFSICLLTPILGQIYPFTGFSVFSTKATSTPAPVVTPVPTPVPTPEPTIEPTPTPTPAPTPAPTPEPTPEPTPDLSKYSPIEKGAIGENVRILQQRLIDLCYLTNDIADGQFGDNTVSAIKKFQKAVGISETGIADEMTQAILFGDVAPKGGFSISNASMVVGSNAKTSWSAGGAEFTLNGSETKVLETLWGTYKFDAFGNYEKIG